MRAITVLLLICAFAPGLAGDTLVPLQRLEGHGRTPTVTLLHNGLVLIVGGGTVSTGVELFDPATRTFRRSQARTWLPLLGHTATLLRDGRVLLAGGGYLTDGRLGFGSFGDDTLAVYDPAADQVHIVAHMNAQRMHHTATLLEDGRVLLAGGVSQNIGGFHVWRTPSSSVDLFDPATNTVTAMPAMRTTRVHHSATLLPDGQVFLFGGLPGDAAEVPAGERFSPALEQFAAVWPSRTSDGHSATWVGNGRVLIVGPHSPFFVDPVTGVVEESHSSLGARGEHDAVLQEDGRVVFLGGPMVSVYDREIDAVVRETVLGFDLQGIDAVRLPDGYLFVAGGNDYYEGKTWLYATSERMRRRSVRIGSAE